uniref:Uncharacterized protein n=1 Tax=Chromera velia CCMP2878 TaxID=1169474 RepID=A0A0G4F107_9ALVE|eukprot:Cvel_14546.t1-p1 / transcript=Cvel_14546.t1 / gene=Cvel_14546 / organism=Chromera_velia_CCMP2878 / gene_product=hypothetical protein / transcript_product=hypothetical protein / location=Cvel_scaffold1039:37190-42047(+) / protein_length=365 / sequence_SO=supercontig / SO=protein_coding / is_pseudo=false
MLNQRVLEGDRMKEYPFNDAKILIQKIKLTHSNGAMERAKREAAKGMKYTSSDKDPLLALVGMNENTRDIQLKIIESMGQEMNSLLEEGRWFSATEVLAAKHAANVHCAAAFAKEIKPLYKDYDEYSEIDFFNAGLEKLNLAAVKAAITTKMAATRSSSRTFSQYLFAEIVKKVVKDKYERILEREKREEQEKAARVAEQQRERLVELDKKKADFLSHDEKEREELSKHHQEDSASIDQHEPQGGQPSEDKEEPENSAPQLEDLQSVLADFFIKPDSTDSFWEAGGEQTGGMIIRTSTLEDITGDDIKSMAVRCGGVTVVITHPIQADLGILVAAVRKRLEGVATVKTDSALYLMDLTMTTHSGA